MKNKKITIIFDFAGTLVKMRPSKLLIAKDLLSQLSQNLDLGLITGAKRSETNNILLKLNIRDYFDFIIAKDDTPFRKPDIRLFREVKRKVTSGKIIYIGDSVKDFVFAKNAKIKFCYIGKRKYGVYQNQDINQIINFIVKNFLT